MKARCKALVDAIALVLVLPAVILYHIGGGVFGREKALVGWSQAFSLAPGLAGVYLRRAFYRMVLRRYAPGAFASFGCVLSHPAAEIGANVYLGPFCSIGDVTLEDDVLLASHVSVVNGQWQHRIDRSDVPVREQPGDCPRITIGCDSWIGERAVVMANVGKHCVIGAAAVVTKPIPDFAIAIGAPAAVVRYRHAKTEPHVSPCERTPTETPQEIPSPLTLTHDACH